MPNPVKQNADPTEREADPGAESGRARASAFSRSITLLDIITAGTAFRFAELQVQTGYPKASLHRALADLIDERLVVFDEHANTYRAGFRLLEWANRIWSRNDLRHLARDALETLSERTGETVMLSVLADTHVVHLDCVESAQSVRTSVSVGHRVPAWCTAAGKALLAAAPTPQREAIIERTAFARFTGNTVTEPGKVLEQLHTVAAHGIAEDNEEHHVGIRCIAAPIVDCAGETVAAISVSAPTFRVEPGSFEQWRQWVRESAHTVGNRLLPTGSAHLT
ncbi:MAG: IclR family transcriptional regulator [Pseudomonadota bacterium]